ncbi:hypothetical protein MMC08_008135 [Hypocenomyce scalaris]|nr:hypothetical protein [Hypocenomyce scalaris]
MGGRAFSHLNPPLSTPRMPPTVYTTLRDKYVTLLSTIYKQVGTPLEAPEKASYGDIDILVASPLVPVPPPVLSTALAAKTSFTTPGSPTTSYAVPYPESQDAYVQLDIHICQPETFAFELFHQSHGDFWNIIGTTIRPFGLTANNVGLHLRVPEIETLDRKQSMLLLTSDPDATLDFLGLDRCRRWRPFESVEELFEYAVGTRFFRKEAYVRTTLKANDRKRMAQRELYRRFVEEWVAKLGEDDDDDEEAEGKESLNRESILDEALDIFKKRGEYEERVERWRMERRELSIKREANEVRRAKTVAEAEYADAWIMELRRAMT